MKFALNKRGRLIVACALSLGAVTVAWTQLGDGPEQEWQDEIQANAADQPQVPAPEEALPEMKFNAAGKTLPAHFNLVASEDTAARQRAAKQDPLSVLTEEDEQPSSVESALSQQSSIKISAVVAGDAAFSPNSIPQYYAANARDKLEGGKGGGGGNAGSDIPNEPGVIGEPDGDDKCKDKADKDESAGNNDKVSPACQDDKGPGSSSGETPPGLDDKPSDKPGDDNGGEGGNGDEGDTVEEGGIGGKDDKPKPEVTVDEPGTAALLGLGLLGLAAFSRRKKRLV